MPSQIILEVESGPIAGQVFVFPDHDTFLFGRTSQCHAHLSSDSFVSRHHFILETNPPDARLQDLGSLNGTYVNQVLCGQRGTGESPEQGAKRPVEFVDLRNNDCIQVGQTRFRVRVEWIGETALFKPVSCTRCGMPSSADVQDRSSETYLCIGCRDTLRSNPIEMLLEPGGIGVNDCGSDSQGRMGPYIIEREVGEGGMGKVYLARHAESGRLLAIKAIVSQVTVNHTQKAHFLREMDVMRALDHPNIVRLHECAADGATFYIAMDYCDGGDLLDATLAGPRPPSWKLLTNVLVQVLRGLAFAHERGYVHRDIKPRNILIHTREKAQVARLADFGLSKNFQKAGLSGMTATGSWGGTPQFMPREQLTQYKYVRPVSDIWSVGATFYWLLTGGRGPREEIEGQSWIDAILSNAVIPILQRRPDIPSRLAAIIDRSLAIDPTKRFQNAGEMIRAMEESGI